MLESWGLVWSVNWVAQFVKKLEAWLVRELGIWLGIELGMGSSDLVSTEYSGDGGATLPDVLSE